MIYPMVRELAADGIPDTVACRVLAPAPSGYYKWSGRDASDRDLEQAYLMKAIIDAPPPPTAPTYLNLT